MEIRVSDKGLVLRVHGTRIYLSERLLGLGFRCKAQDWDFASTLEKASLRSESLVFTLSVCVWGGGKGKLQM